MDKQLEATFERQTRDWYAYLVACLAFLVAAVVIWAFPGEATTASKTGILPRPLAVALNEPATVTSLAGGLHGVFAGTEQGSVWVIHQDRSPKRIGVGGSVAALSLSDVGLWVGVNRQNEPSDLVLVRDPLSPEPSVQVQKIGLGGLGQDCKVTALAGSIGRLWVGTTKGLLSYDWAGWAKYSPPSRFPLKDHIPSVTCLYLDARGVLWIGSRLGLLSYNGSEMFRHTKSDGLPSDHVTSLSGDSGFSLLCGTEEGLAILEKGLWVRQARVSDEVTAVLSVGETVWVGTTKGLWYKGEGDWLRVGEGSAFGGGLVPALAFGADRVYAFSADNVWQLPLGPQVLAWDAEEAKGVVSAPQVGPPAAVPSPGASPVVSPSAAAP